MIDSMHKVICLIPAAGKGTRMQPYRGAKDLMIIGYKNCMINGKPKRVPKILGEYVLDNMLTTGSKNIIMITNENKSELLKFYGDGSQYGASIAYVCQNSDSKYYGMPVAIDQSYTWINDSTVLLGMPDTIVKPSNSYALLLDEHRAKNADLTLGIFPTNDPNKLAPVRFDRKTGKVIEIYDKPKTTKIYNTWNIVIWEPVFTELLHDYVKHYKNNFNQASGEIILSDIFNLAIDKKLRVFAHQFEDGCCYDLGDTEKFVSAMVSMGFKSNFDSETVI